MSNVFNGPVPGQSLTSEPKGFPFERPADIVDPLEALDLHIDNMSKPESIEDALFFLEAGLDLVTLVEGILRSAVMEGIHSVDVSLIIAPALHEFIKGAALRADVEFDEGFEQKDAKKIISYRRNVRRAQRMLDEVRGENRPDPMSLEDTQMPEMTETMEEPVEEEPQQGLMARRV